MASVPAPSSHCALQDPFLGVKLAFLVHWKNMEGPWPARQRWIRVWSVYPSVFAVIADIVAAIRGEPAEYFLHLGSNVPWLVLLPMLLPVCEGVWDCIHEQKPQPCWLTDGKTPMFDVVVILLNLAFLFFSFIVNPILSAPTLGVFGPSANEWTQLTPSRRMEKIINLLPAGIWIFTLAGYLFKICCNQHSNPCFSSSYCVLTYVVFCTGSIMTFVATIMAAFHTFQLIPEYLKQNCKTDTEDVRQGLINCYMESRKITTELSELVRVILALIILAILFFFW
jgi:hypothetical protein